MTGLRTIWGISTEYIESNFNANFQKLFSGKNSKAHCSKKCKNQG